MTDKLADDELVERLRLLEREWASMYNVFSGFPKDGTNATIQDTITRLQATPDPWIKISDIPKEWKDGRPLNVWNCGFDEVEKDYKFNSDGMLCDDFWNIVEFEDEKITHAMLPPAPPQQKETQ